MTMASQSDELRPLSDNERNALRAWLQRSEVRLSTLHRIGLAFISGAGLLLLVPVFFKDAVHDIVAVMLREFGNFYPALGETGGIVLTIILYLLIIYPFLLSLLTPIYAVYLVLMDIVHFYFTIYMPGSSNQMLNPTLPLSGLTFWADESADIKRAILHYQYQPNRMNFMLPFSESKRGLYFDKMIENTGGFIIPKTRTLDKLRALSAIPPEANEVDVQRFNAAMGLARSLDRTLVEDVATTEMSLVRHILYLRRLILRYVKTLLVFIWTIVVVFFLLPFLEYKRFPTILILSVGYICWSTIAMMVLRAPLSWIYRHRQNGTYPEHVDIQLTLLEDRLRVYIRLAIVSSILATLLAVIANV